MSASSQCPHFNYNFQVNVARFENDTVKYADITGKCVDCGKPIVWRSNLPVGVNPYHPMLSPDALELRVPCSVAGDDVDENVPRPMFEVR